jgi:hypothetical protein
VWGIALPFFDQDPVAQPCATAEPDGPPEAPLAAGDGQAGGLSSWQPSSNTPSATSRQGARIIKRHDGEPAPAQPIERDPNLKSWSAHLIGGKKMQLLGYLGAVTEAAAIERAVMLFSLDDERRKRLAINLRR